MFVKWRALRFSHTFDCAVEGRYGMYTLVHYYGGWIDSVLNSRAFQCATCPCVGPADTVGCSRGYSGLKAGDCTACAPGTSKNSQV